MAKKKSHGCKCTTVKQRRCRRKNGTLGKSCRKGRK